MDERRTEASRIARMPGSMSPRRLTRREVGLAVIGACLLAIVMTWPLILHLGSTVPRDIGDPARRGLAARLGRARAAPPAPALLRREPLLADQVLARLRRCADRIRPGGNHRQRAARGDGPLRPALHLRLRARLLRRVPARPRARARAGRGRDRRRGLRLRAVPSRAGRPPAGDLERRHPAGGRLRRPRHPAEAARGGCSGPGSSRPGSSRSAGRSVFRSPMGSPEPC